MPRFSPRGGRAASESALKTEVADVVADCPPVVDLVGVGRTYDGLQPVLALSDVNLRIKTGEYIAVTGPSGSGKSTLLNLIGLLDRPTVGTLRIDGVDSGALSERYRSTLRGRKIGFVFQSFHLMPHRSAVENVMLAGLYDGKSSRDRREAALAAVDRVGLSSRRNALPPQMSGGERQRVALARALAQSPSLLLCDEPTGNLDSTRTDDILDLLDMLNADGVTIVTITHDPRVAARAQRRVLISDGLLTE